VALSGREIQRLGVRLRDGEPTAEDLKILDEFRREFDARLLSISGSVSTALRRAGIEYLLAGRAKRTKSIIRKLRRGANRNMDLSRMDDIVGLRVIVASLAAQQQVLDEVRKTHVQVRDPYDYRASPIGTYRALHLVLGEPARRIELQVRTLPQHLWADACERFGERAKEGSPSGDEQRYLDELGAYCAAVDEGAASDSDDRFSSRLRQLAGGLSKTAGESHHTRSYVVVYNVGTDELVRCEQFPDTEEGRSEALQFYRYQVRSLSDVNFDVLVLNASSEGALRVTHPRYFPE
jgi:ppGpp synthetase/RelA/SpoT-type nucleotidyltranferase